MVFLIAAVLCDSTPCFCIELLLIALGIAKVVFGERRIYFANSTDYHCSEYISGLSRMCLNVRYICVYSSLIGVKSLC